MSGTLDLRFVPLILSLGLDTFALSTALGVAPLPVRTRLRLALTFAAAEGLMPAVGLLLGRPLGDAIGGWAVYIAAALLIATGAWLLREGLEDDDDDDDEAGGEAARIMSAATAHGLPLLGIALSVSLDELAMGFSFGVLRLPVVPALIAIALQARAVSLGGSGSGNGWVRRSANAPKWPPAWSSSCSDSPLASGASPASPASKRYPQRFWHSGSPFLARTSSFSAVGSHSS